MTTIRYARKAARRLFKDCMIGPLIDEERARRVVIHVIEAHRRSGHQILSHFRRLVRLECDRHQANVESAVPLAGDLRERVESFLAETHGPGLTHTFTENPALIGGMRIKVGSDIYDGSVRARLAAIEARLEEVQR